MGWATLREVRHRLRIGPVGAVVVAGLVTIGLARALRAVPPLAGEEFPGTTVSSGDRAPLSKVSQERLDAAERLFETAQRLHQAGHVPLDRVVQASRRLMEARRDHAADAAGRFQAVADHAARMATLVAAVSTRAEGGGTSEMDLREAEYALAEARVWQRNDPAAFAFQLDQRNRAVIRALNRRVPLRFPIETPLTEVLQHIRRGTENPELPNGIPIYVDPVGLLESERTETSPVRIDLDGVPLRTTLPLLLDQLGLTFVVKDGLIVILSPDQVWDRYAEGEPVVGEPPVRGYGAIPLTGLPRRPVLP